MIKADKLYWIAMGFVLGSRLCGSVQLTGVTKLNWERGSPLHGVEIFSSDASGRATSRSDGSFRLIFPEKSAGDKVSLTIKRAGYAVINDYDLTYVFRDGKDGYVIIYLCEEAERAQRRTKYFAGKLAQVYERNFKIRSDELVASAAGSAAI